MKIQDGGMTEESDNNLVAKSITFH